ncbi:hypothetical protein, unlikely [Trypanosoma brucei brucei TREU927]|uniref:Uncharacterized protein n=1 Tax=Trypanosoma brucei brucei (strain 927/4 GUTat10.1) TaxID=185431 RepID=Q38FN6_TRYB2|nr:hypothetical protein, unlikely [Trypanosoma brucei brucei TREU927]EAN76384.1 hypothetical protein, unlikely [Trypanosoma brucei brucei TREU927]
MCGAKRTKDTREGTYPALPLIYTMRKGDKKGLSSFSGSQQCWKIYEHQQSLMASRCCRHNFHGAEVALFVFICP